MSYSSCLVDVSADLILDASVFINLSASGVAKDILRLLPQRSHMVDVAVSEVRVDSKTGRSDSQILQELLNPSMLGILQLDENGLAFFERLVLALDDGEAATIAAAASRCSVVVVDERKARRICSEEFPETFQASTVDIFAHPSIGQELGRNKLADAVHAALRQARMHVRSDQRDWVVDLIGVDKAAECRSIPRAKA